MLLNNKKVFISKISKSKLENQNISSDEKILDLTKFSILNTDISVTGICLIEKDNEKNIGIISNDKNYIIDDNNNLILIN